METKPKEPKRHMKGFVIKQKSLLLATDKENKRFFKCNYHINASSWEFFLMWLGKKNTQQPESLTQVTISRGGKEKQTARIENVGKGL